MAVGGLSSLSGSSGRPAPKFQPGDYVEWSQGRGDVWKVDQISYDHKRSQFIYEIRHNDTGRREMAEEYNIRPYPNMTTQTVNGTQIINIPMTVTYDSSYDSSQEKPKPKPKPPKPTVDFDSVFLPDDKKEAILDAIKQIDHHQLIFNTWGFGEKFEKGTAVSMLFYGPPGTGKTMIAQAIADKYGKKLKVISTAEIESSEPGQAERNLKAYFENTKDDTVLLFDECDSLIADRARVGMILAAQINALLMGLEKFRGIVIFTTNRLYALDPAFERRLSLKVEFEMPDASLRKKIWQNMFPKKAPLAKNIDWDKIASVNIAGGNIKNVVLRCARAAANSKAKKITQAVIIKALEEELKSMIAFEEALDSNRLPALVGGDYRITKGAAQ